MYLNLFQEQDSDIHFAQFCQQFKSDRETIKDQTVFELWPILFFVFVFVFVFLGGAVFSL